LTRQLNVVDHPARACGAAGIVTSAITSSHVAALPASEVDECTFSSLPDPQWKPGDGGRVDAPVSTGEYVETAPGKGDCGQYFQMSPGELAPGKSAYALLISAVVPRPIAFVSSQSADGVVNLAPFSFFGLMCHDPPTVVFTTVHRGGQPKDTLANVRETGECVVNIIGESFVEAANVCSGEFTSDVDEFELSGLTKVPSKALPCGTPRVGEAGVQLECKVVEIRDLVGRGGKPTASMIICEIQMIHIHKDVHRVTKNGSDYVQFDGLKPMSRLGANDYGRTGGVFAMPRPPNDLRL